MIEKPLTVAELAALLGMSESWVEKQCAARAIPFTKVGRQNRFTEAHVAAILAAGEQTPINAPATVLRLRARRAA